MIRKVIAGFILISLPFSTFADDCFGCLGQPNLMWPIIKSTVSKEHKLKLSKQDSSAYFMPDTGH